MADEVNGVSGKVGLDNSDFKTGTAEIARSLRVVESSFRASAASMTDWTKNATGLEARIKTLNNEIELQAQKVELTRLEHERLTQAEGEGSKAAQDMEIRLNKETEKLNAMKSELGQTEATLKEVNDSSREASKGVDALTVAATAGKLALTGMKGVAQGLVLELKAVAVVIKGELAVALGILKVGVGSIVALGGAALVAGALIAGLTFKAADAADKLGELSDKTGLSILRLQELGFIGKITGTDLETVTGANARLIRSMAGAQGGTGTAAKAFRELGISVKDSHGKLRDANVVFGDVLDALGKIQNPTERDALAMEIFGKNAQELNPLIKLGSKGMREMAGDARSLGAVVSTSAIIALGNLQDQLDGLKLGLSGVGTSILVAFAPFFGGALDQAKGLLERIVTIVQNSGGDFSKMAEGLSGLFQEVIAGLAKQIPALLQSGLGIVKIIVQSILGALPDIIDAAVSIITTLADFIVQNLPLLSEVALKLLDALSGALITVLPILINTGLQIITTLISAILQVLPGLLPQLAQTGLSIVGQILISIQDALPGLIDAAPMIISTLIGFLKTNLVLLIQIGIPLINQLIQAILPQLPALVDAALQIILALADGITAVLPTLTPALVDVITQIVLILAQNAPLLIEAALKLLIALTKGLIAALPILIPAIPVIIKALVDGLINHRTELVRSAGELIGALIIGIISAIPLVAVAIQKIDQTILETLFSQKANLLDVGHDLIDGLWEGIKDGWASLISNFESLVELLPQAVRDALGIHSSSSVGFAITKNFVGSLGLGGLSAIGDVVRTFGSIGRQLALATAGSMAMAPAGGLANNTTQVTNDNFGFNNYGNVYLGGPQTPSSIAARIKAKRY